MVVAFARPWARRVSRLEPFLCAVNGEGGSRAALFWFPYEEVFAEGVAQFSSHGALRKFLPVR